MGVYKFIYFLTMFVCVMGQQGQLLKPCSMSDMECIRNTTQQFLENTANGIPQYDIRPIDPMVINEINYDQGKNTGVKYEFNNITITGLKNLDISDFQMDTKKKQVHLTMKVNTNIKGSVTVKFIKEGKSFTGTFSGSADEIATSIYGYNMNKGEDGVEHFEVLPETIIYENVAPFTFSLDIDLLQAIDKDADIAETRIQYYSSRQNNEHEVVSDLMKKAVPVLIHNLRQAARILPKSAFFTDVEK